MSCNITSGIAKGCNTNIGGVKNVYLGNGPVVTTWYKYEMDKGTASLVETYNVNQAASIIGYTQALTIQLAKMEAAKQLQIAKIAEANDMRVLVETNNGTTFELGTERGAYLASGTSTSGTAYTDANQAELVIQADSKDPMPITNLYEQTGTLYVHATDSRPRQLFDSTPPNTGCGCNSYFSANENILVDTYGWWDYYGCGELPYSNTVPPTWPLDNQIYYKVVAEIEVTATTSQADWNEWKEGYFTFYNTTNLPVFPPKPADWPTIPEQPNVVGIPEQVPAVGETFTLVVDIQTGPLINPGPNHSFIFGAFRYWNPAYGNTTCVTWLQQNTCDIKYYLL